MQANVFCVVFQIHLSISWNPSTIGLAMATVTHAQTEAADDSIREALAIPLKVKIRHGKDGARHPRLIQHGKKETNTSTQPQTMTRETSRRRRTI